MTKKSDSNASAKNAVSGIKIYRRLLSHVIPYWKVFIFSVVGMAIYAVTDAAFAFLMKP